MILSRVLVLYLNELLYARASSGDVWRIKTSEKSFHLSIVSRINFRARMSHWREIKGRECFYFFLYFRVAWNFNEKHKKIQLEGKVKHVRFLLKHCLQFFSPLASFILFFWKMLSLLSSDLCSDLLNRANSSGGSEDGQIIVKCCLHTSKCYKIEHSKWQMEIAVCRTRLGCKKDSISFDSRRWRKMSLFSNIKVLSIYFWHIDFQFMEA